MTMTGEARATSESCRSAPRPVEVVELGEVRRRAHDLHVGEPAIPAPQRLAPWIVAPTSRQDVHRRRMRSISARRQVLAAQRLQELVAPPDDAELGHDEHVRAEREDLLAHEPIEARDHRDHGDDRSHADHDAEQGQPAAQPMGPDRIEGDAHRPRAGGSRLLALRLRRGDAHRAPVLQLAQRAKRAGDDRIARSLTPLLTSISSEPVRPVVTRAKRGLPVGEADRRPPRPRGPPTASPRADWDSAPDRG